MVFSNTCITSEAEIAPRVGMTPANRCLALLAGVFAQNRGSVRPPTEAA